MKEICIAAIGTRGDVLPVAALADILRKNNHLTIISSPDHKRMFNQTPDTFLPLGDDFGKVAGSGDIAYFRNEMEKQFSSHQAAYEQADVIIGAGLFYAGRTWAEYCGKPYYHLFYTPQVLKSDSYAPAGIKKPFRSKLHNRILWMKSMGENDFILKSLINRKRRVMRLKPIQSVYRYFIDQPDTVIALDDIVAGIPKRYTSYVKQVHTLQYQDETPLSEELTEFLSKGTKPVLINFGSAEHTVKGFVKLLERTMNAVSGLGFRMVVICDTDDAIGGLAGENAFVCRYAPHAALMPKVEALIHHGGIGTLYAALKSAKPQVVVPQALDQFYWAETIEQRQWGKAVYADRGDFTARLAEALESARNAPAIRKTMDEMSRLMHSAQYREEGLKKLREALPACFGGIAEV